MNVTMSGLHCKPWEQSLTELSESYVEVFPHAGLDGNNYCRNPPLGDESRNGNISCAIG